jgi:hypothetical protein
MTAGTPPHFIIDKPTGIALLIVASIALAILATFWPMLLPDVPDRNAKVPASFGMDDARERAQLKYRIRLEAVEDEISYKYSSKTPAHIPVRVPAQ